MIDNGPSLQALIKRYTQTSTSMGGFLAKALLAKTLGRGHDSPANALVDVLGSLKGPLLKIGQIASIVPDLLPQEYAEALQNLQNNAPPMGVLFVRRRMRGELGIDWEKYFKIFYMEPFAAASLGQVHKAEDGQGNVVACKLQYPDMETAVEADLNQLKMIASVYKATGPAIDTDNIFVEVSSYLQEELDYTKEAQNILLFKSILKKYPFIRVPDVKKPLSTKRLLTLSFLEGKKIQDFYDAPQELRNQIAKQLFYAWYYPFYSRGILHGDPHFGNYSIAEDGTLNMLDFGCVRHFEKNFLQGVVTLYKGLLFDDAKRIKEAYVLWGFQDSPSETIEVLNWWARYLYGPLLDDKQRCVDANGLQGKEIAKAVYKRLKELGGLCPPREFVLMDRVAVGLGSAFIRLRAHLNWHRLFEEMLEENNLSG